MSKPPAKPQLPIRAKLEGDKNDVMKRLFEVWKKQPYLRLGQLIGNVYHYPSGVDPYYAEDRTFIEKIEAFYKDKDAL